MSLSSLPKGVAATVANIESRIISPVIPGLEKLQPQVLFDEAYTFELTGVNNAVANGLRRVLCNELPGLAMWFEIEHYTTNNPFSIVNMIRNRVRLVPIAQSVDPAAVFELDVTNATAEIMTVYTTDIRQIAGRTAAIFNRMPLFTLEPGRWLAISRIIVRRDYGYNFDGHSLASNVVSLALDQAPPPEFDASVSQELTNSIANTVEELAQHDEHISIEIRPLPDAEFEDTVEAAAHRVPAAQSDPRHWRISFITNGTAPGKVLVAAACDELIAKMERVIDALDTIEREAELYILTMPGLSHTTGNLIIRTIADIYPDATATYSVESMARTMQLRVRTDDDIADVLKRCTAVVIAQYKAIRTYFET